MLVDNVPQNGVALYMTPCSEWQGKHIESLSCRISATKKERLTGNDESGEEHALDVKAITS